MATPERSGAEGAVALQPAPLDFAPPEAGGKPSAGPRVVGGRVYDPENGKTCHQCRQKTISFAASCKQVKKRGPCPIKYCQKCLLNRYGENAEEVAGLENWMCPKCRDICNCSFCRKKNGQQPTGIMAHIAKATGCSSVHDLLAKGTEVVAAAQAMNVNGSEKQSKKGAQGRSTAADESVAGESGNLGIDLNAVPEDQAGGNIGIHVNSVPSIHIKKKQKRRDNIKDHLGNERSHDEENREPLPGDGRTNALEKNIVLPRGTPVTDIAGVQLENVDVGAAIQLFEFCSTFKEMFEIRKGQPERILQDIVRGRELRLVSSLVADFHIKLLSAICKGRGNKSQAYTRDGDEWVIDIGKYINESMFMSKELPLDSLNQGIYGYKNLSPSCKLRILNFLCDEALSTEKLRNSIDEQNDIAAEQMNAAREKVRAAKEKEKELKEKLKNNMSKAILLQDKAAALSVEENKDLMSQLKEAGKVKHAAMNGMATEKREGDLWIKPLMVEKGVAYWKLDRYFENATIVRQEYGDDLTGNKDSWFMFTEDEEKTIEEYIATRSKHLMRKRIRI